MSQSRFNDNITGLHPGDYTCNIVIFSLQHRESIAVNRFCRVVAVQKCKISPPLAVLHNLVCSKTPYVIQPVASHSVSYSISGPLLENHVVEYLTEFFLSEAECKRCV